MKNRTLLKEIPKGKFHSVIFTTYSLNLYYLEQQVLPILGSSGIHYVSVLADGKMLSNQLKQYGFLSQPRKRNYAIHGIQSKGAFHPKLIFLAGQDSILVLVGSGNLTSSGHGKNLEVWNPVFISNHEDAKFGFALHVWKYVKELHTDLGDAATNKLRSIEENCTLLNNFTDESPSPIFNLNEQTSISFHANRKNHSLFTQLSETVGEDEIDEITIMCLYHDVKGKFIQALNEHFSPKKINVLIQKNFGELPFQMKKTPNVRFLDWTAVLSTRQPQQYFHAKNKER